MSIHILSYRFFLT